VQQANEVAEGTPQLSPPSHHGGGRGQGAQQRRGRGRPCLRRVFRGKKT
jgi:hypothetical protein